MELTQENLEALKAQCDLCLKSTLPFSVKMAAHDLSLAALKMQLALLKAGQDDHDLTIAALKMQLELLKARP